MGIRYNPAIDGLRAIAVLAVVAFHAGLPVPAGFVGVDVFFVISGYLITRLLTDELPQIDFVRFYARRARRILPAMTLVVAATLTASIALLPNAHDATQSAAAAAAFVANVFFQTKTGGYWSASASTMPLLHLWSLSVEEQFYLVWPLVLMLGRKRPVAVLWTMAVASLVAAETLMMWAPNAAFFQMPARAWELAAGGLVALGAIRARGVGAGLLIMVAGCIMPVPHFPGLGALPVVVGATWLLSALHHGDRMRMLEARPLVFVGLISYSLYLWHWPLLALARATRLGETPLDLRLGLCALAFLLATLTWRYVEMPFRRARWDARRTLAASFLIAATMSVGALAAAPPTRPTSHNAEALHCASGVMQAPECIAGQPKVVLWGDSFARPWQPLAISLASKQGLPVTRFFTPECPVTMERIDRRTPWLTRECHAYNMSVLGYITANGADTVVIASDYADTLREHPEVRLESLVAALQPHVRHIVFVAPTPFLRDEIANCEGAGDGCMVSRAEFEAQAGAARKALSQLTGVEIVDAAEWFLSRDRSAYDDQKHVSSSAVAQFVAARRD